MNIYIHTVPNWQIQKRRGFTGADWWVDEHGAYQIRIAEELKPWVWRAALIIHELFEMLVCVHLGITYQQVDEFDLKHQDNELHGLNAGDESDCPYKVPHSLATAAERIFAGFVGINWKEYDDALAAL